MLLLVILYIFQGFINIDAAPLSVHFFPRHAGSTSPLLQECVCPNTRSIWDIIWGCLVTIFVCSWVSVHPNIPESGEPWWKTFLRRLELMVWSVLTPELIILWAMQQWLAARKLGEKYRGNGWTTIHGYFIQMGGFMLYDGEKVVGVLNPHDLDNLIAEGKIELPSITEEGIQDRSKGDGLSKALVIVQMTWFVVQCIARKLEGLVITEIELVTLAFAVLNGAMYFFWWNKPLDVKSTVAVYLKHLPAERDTQLEKGKHLVENVPVMTICGNQQENEPEDPSLISSQPVKSKMSVDLEPSPASGNQLVENDESRVESTANTDANGNGGKPESDLERADLSTLPDAQAPSQHRARDSINVGHLAFRACWLLSRVLFRWPAAAIWALITRLYDIIDTDTIAQGKLRVNTFYAYTGNISPLERNGLACLFSVIAGLFGAIHCAGWEFFFPSLIEAKIWRVSSAIITGVPVFAILTSMMEMLYDRYYQDNSPLSLAIAATSMVMIVMLPFYLLARMALLVEALISLRDLPPEAFQVVEWTTFIPHV